MTRLRIKQAARTGFLKETNLLSTYLIKIKNYVQNRMVHESSRLNLIQTKIETHSPKFLTERGYTITTMNGKRLTSTQEIKTGDKITTHLPDGNFNSKILYINK